MKRVITAPKVGDLDPLDYHNNASVVVGKPATFNVELPLGVQLTTVNAVLSVMVTGCLQDKIAV